MSSKKAMLDWLEAENKLDFELGKNEQDENAIKAAEEAVSAARETYRVALEEEQDAPAPLIERAKLSNYLEAAWKGLPLEGAERELNEELGIEPMSPREVRIPFAMMMPDTERLEFADAITNISGTAAIRDHNVRPIIENIWPSLIAPQIGLGFTMVGTGDLTTRWVTSRATADFVAPNTSRDTEALALASDTVHLTRITGGMRVTQESLFSVSGLRSAIVNEIRNAIGDQMDHEVIIGDGATPTREKGLFNFINVYSDVASVQEANTFNDVRALKSKYVDQLWFRRDDSDMRILMGVETGNYLETLPSNQNNRLLSAYELLATKFRIIEGAAGQVPAKDAKDAGKHGEQQKALIVGARGLRHVFVPVWSSVGLVADDLGDEARAGTMAFLVNAYMGLAYANFSGRSGTNQVIKGWQGIQFTLTDD